MDDEIKTAEAFLLRSRSRQWSFEIQVDVETEGAGSCYASPAEALEAAQEAFPTWRCRQSCRRIKIDLPTL